MAAHSIISLLRRLLTAVILLCGIGLAADTLPDRLSDEEFWRLATDFSERAGTFQSDNLLSNERWFQHVVPPLVQRARQNRVYVGVGPEQNFTYIVALKPKMAF